MSSTAQANEGEKILIVDDDARLRRLLERFLDEQGYRVRTVENTEQMDRLLSRELFQLVVLDLMMPGEDGLSACRRQPSRRRKASSPVARTYLPSAKLMSALMWYCAVPAA